MSWAGQHVPPASWFPKGITYHARVQGGQGVGEGNIDVYHCASMTLRNSTTLHNVTFALEYVPADVASDVPGAKTPLGTTYVFEVLADDPQLVAYLNDTGFPATQSVTTIMTDPAGIIRINIAVQGAPWYSITVLPTGTQELLVPFDTTFRMFGGNPNVTWMNAHVQAKLEQSLTDTFALTATGGRLKEIGAPDFVYNGISVEDFDMDGNFTVRPL